MQIALLYRFNIRPHPFASSYGVSYFITTGCESKNARGRTTRCETTVAEVRLLMLVHFPTFLYSIFKYLADHIEMWQTLSLKQYSSDTINTIPH